MYSVNSYSRQILLFLDCFIQPPFDDSELLNIGNILSYFLKKIYSSIFVAFGVVFSDLYPKLLNLGLCLSKEHSLVFQNYSIIMFHCVFDIYAFYRCYNIFIYQVLFPTHILALHSYSVVGVLIF